MDKQPISKTKLKSFLICGHFYKRQYIDKAEASNTIDISGLIRGITVHEITEKIDEGFDLDNKSIENMFLKNFSKRIKKDIIITNLDELNEKFAPDDIYNNDPETMKWQKYYFSREVYNFCEFEYKEDMDKIINVLPLYAEIYKGISGKLKTISKKFIEERESCEFKVNDSLTIVTTQIFDRIFIMKGYDIIDIERQEFTEETLKKELLKNKKDDLIQICKELGILLEIKETKDSLSDAILSKTYKEKKKEYDEQIQKEKDKQSSFLKKMGYELNDYIPIIMEIKSTTMSKNETDIKQLLDSYLYSMFFHYNYKKLPVFMILYLIVTPAGNTKYQIFTHYISQEQLDNVKTNFEYDCIRIFLAHEYKKNFSEVNFLCNEKKCKYFKECQEDLYLIITTKK